MPAHHEEIAAVGVNQAHAGARSSTVERRVAAIGQHHHRANNYPAPGAHAHAGGLREAMAGIPRAPSERKTRKDSADALRHVLAEIKGDGLPAMRDRALLALGRAAALRRSELVALTLGSVAVVERGLELRLGATKTHHAGKGATIAIPEGMWPRPTARLTDWIMAVDVEGGDAEPHPGREGGAAPVSPADARRRAHACRCRTRRWRDW